MRGLHGRLTLTKSAAKGGTHDQTNCTPQIPALWVKTRPSSTPMDERIATAEWADPALVEETYLYRDGEVWLGRSASDHSFPSAFAMTAMSAW